MRLIVSYHINYLCFIRFFIVVVVLFSWLFFFFFWRVFLLLGTYSFVFSFCSTLRGGFYALDEAVTSPSLERMASCRR